MGLEKQWLREERAMASDVDALLEQAVRERWSIARTLQETLPLLRERTGAAGVLVRAVDDELRARAFACGEAPRGERADEWLQQAERRAAGRDQPLDEPAPGGGTRLLYPLEVAGETLGVAVADLPPDTPQATERAARLMRTFCEHLDTFLAVVGLSRERHQVQRQLAAALRHPILEDGLRRATELLAAHVRFETLVVAWRYPDAPQEVSVLVHEARKGRLLSSRRADGEGEADALLRRWALDPEGAGPLAEALGIAGRFEEVLVQGVTRRRVLGRVLAGRADGEFALHDRELLEVFADVLAQRVVDLQREWTLLSSTFPRPVVERLLREEDYARRRLRPVERQLAILYTDISGFTRICGEVLREPSKVATLVDRWSERAVAILWEEGGAFDKMVGDCIIGLWGPPFFEMSPTEACRRAARAAWRIREWTRQLLDDPVVGPLFPEGHAPLQVASGLQWTAASVGRFGPDGDYTAFGDGMNNAARLQGLAEAGQILCMDAFAEQLRAPDCLGAPRSARAKNVAEPLRFRELLREPPGP